MAAKALSSFKRPLYLWGLQIEIHYSNRHACGTRCHLHRIKTLFCGRSHVGILMRPRKIPAAVGGQSHNPILSNCPICQLCWLTRCWQHLTSTVTVFSGFHYVTNDSDFQSGHEFSRSWENRSRYFFSKLKFLKQVPLATQYVFAGQQWWPIGMQCAVTVQQRYCSARIKVCLQLVQVVQISTNT